jgi:hypothetical protein
VEVHQRKILTLLRKLSFLPPPFSFSSLLATDLCFDLLRNSAIFLATYLLHLLLQSLFSSVLLSALFPFKLVLHFFPTQIMGTTTPDIDSLISQTTALTWEDPNSQLESIPLEQGSSELLPLVGRVISQKTLNNQSVNAVLTKA